MHVGENSLVASLWSSMEFDSSLPNLISMEKTLNGWCFDNNEKIEDELKVSFIKTIFLWVLIKKIYFFQYSLIFFISNIRIYFFLSLVTFRCVYLYSSCDWMSPLFVIK